MKAVELETFKILLKSLNIIHQVQTQQVVLIVILFGKSIRKTVKYARFTVVPYNKVNDRVKGKYDYNDNGEKVLKVTGPVKSKQIDGYGAYWDCVWYNWTIDYMLITGIEIEYLDGSIISTSDVNIIQELGYTRKPNS